MSAKQDEDALIGLAQEFRDALRQSVYVLRRLDAHGELSSAQLSVLKMALDGGARVGEIARDLGVKVPSATEQIIRLERAGLLRREADPNDSRAVRVAATAEGRAAVDLADRRRNERIAAILATLGRDERDAIRAALPVFHKINSSVRD
ncbi:MarR family winged helix-turn-helix transcriptional regulator [Arthrobacter cupressi]|uniref:DNA-binding transcriptional regulator, MarR family n=1 Tax=Arthrobacter cupressi TaxID=1045773 RepID=A0A1G8RE69_9MICC|nr:MarR family transcriptional regulator [Arthrobacter cupressi]NYD77776.1 DNA-binding MarR family transcriptional regulator [Arthrobacter cupressi]SDJ14805.1 DNA-binding transcriptional regulator, MarR family [Arthrobacter cupressi]